MTSQPPHINRWRAFALLAMAFFMTVIDLTIVDVSLPTIGRDLHFSESRAGGAGEGHRRPALYRNRLQAARLGRS